MSAEEISRESARNGAAEMAPAADETRPTHAELDRFADRMAAVLGARGIEPGDCVAVLMEGSWQAAVSVSALLKAGAIVKPVDPATTAGEVAELINASRATGLLTQSSLAVAAAAAMAATPTLRLTVIAGCQGAPVIDGIMRFEDAICGDAPAAA